MDDLVWTLTHHDAFVVIELGLFKIHNLNDYKRNTQNHFGRSFSQCETISETNGSTEGSF